MSPTAPAQHAPRKQQGVALMIMLVIMIMGVVTYMVNSLNSSAPQIGRNIKNATVLAQAKEALIGYATSVNLTSGTARPGDLPCPDIDNDGYQELSCGNASGSTGQALRIGRLPWKTLRLPDLRDSSGERLWYAVSNNFKYSTKTTCTNSNLTGCLNSDTTGTITVYGSGGSILNTANTSTGAVAVIIAPGAVLQRQDGVAQTRGCTVGVDCDAAEKCTSSPATAVAKCNPANYLDTATVAGITEDNASFVDGSTSNGFIQGRILNGNGQIIVNDQLLVITRNQVTPLLEKRVAAEVKNCLTEYAAMPQNQGPPPNQGYYPWATARTAGTPVVYQDSDQLEFGHIPDMPFEQTCHDTGGSNCSSVQSGGMENSWGATCTLTNSNWWVNWKEKVFYGFAHSLRPHDLSHNHACAINTSCLTVNPPNSSADKPFVVIVAGNIIGSQTRPSNNFANYLEGNNSDGTSPFEQSPASSTFNDWVTFP